MRVRSVVIELDGYIAALNVRLDPKEFPVTGSELGFSANIVKVVLQTGREFVRLDYALETKNQRYAILIQVNAGVDAPGACQDCHPAFVRSNQCTFRGRERDVKNSVGVKTVDQKRPRDAEGHLRCTYRVFNVALHLIGRNTKV